LARIAVSQAVAIIGTKLANFSDDVEDLSRVSQALVRARSSALTKKLLI
jgi:hypothetical protein